MKLCSLLFLMISLNLWADEIDPFKVSINSSHQIKLLNHGLASFEERLQMVENAKRTIDVEYFIYNLDNSGRIFSQALIKKANEGVKIRMLLDYAMIKSQFSPFYANEMAKNGIEIKYFNPTSTLNFFSGTYRNHRKVLLIDGEEAITGGRNIGDEYFDLSEEFNFLDRDFKIKGEIVFHIQKTFDQVWSNKASKVVMPESRPLPQDINYRKEDGSYDKYAYQNDLKKYNNKVDAAVEFLSVANEKLVKEIRSIGKTQLANEYSGSCENLSFNSEYPIIGKKNRSVRIIKHDISNRIKNAKKSILFDSPYFIVNEESKTALDLALDNKINVTLLTNSMNSTDAVYVYDVFDSIIKSWINKGLETYIYKGNLPLNYVTMNDEIARARFGIHAKSFVFDNEDVVIGTFNFDPRSANLNTEMTISCDNNSELARIVSSDIKERIKGSIFLDSSKAVNVNEFYHAGFLKRIEYYLLKIPANIFDYLL